MDAYLENTFIAANEKTQYDTSAKNLLSQKDILSHILLATVDEFHGMKPEDVEACIEGEIFVSSVPVDPGLTNAVHAGAGNHIAGLNTVQEENQEGLIIYDILFYVRMKDGLSQMIIDLEPQRQMESGYDVLNRAIFYASRLVSSQKERDFTGQNFNDMKRVYTIFICMNMKDCIWNYIHLTNDALLSDYNWKGKLDLLNIVLLGLPNGTPKRGDGYRLHRLLGALFSVDLSGAERIEILENEYNMAEDSDCSREVLKMSGLGQGIFDLGMERGMKRGIEQGVAQGVAQGIAQGELSKAHEMAVKLYAKGWDTGEIAQLLNYGIDQVYDWLAGGRASEKGAQ